VATRLASILGPVTYGAVTWMTGGNHRLAILATGVFFLVAIGCLVAVDERRGRATALLGKPS
jgi:MFS transporter, UMF1 family